MLLQRRRQWRSLGFDVDVEESEPQYDQPQYDQGIDLVTNTNPNPNKSFEDFKNRNGSEIQRMVRIHPLNLMRKIFRTKYLRTNLSSL